MTQSLSNVFLSVWIISLVSRTAQTEFQLLGVVKPGTSGIIGTGIGGGTATLILSSGTTCPSPWVESSTKCIRFVNNVRMTYAEAKTHCATLDSTLLMVNDLTEATLIANWLDANANPKTESWYTSGISNDQLPGQFLWDGYGIDIGANYASLWLINLAWYQDPANIWLLTGKKVVYTYDGQRWGFNVSNATDYRPFICQISKSIATQSIAAQRDYTFGVYNPADYLLGPQFTIQPPQQLIYMKPFDPSISSSPPISFECQASGIPSPTYTWYRVGAGAGNMTQINPLAAGQGNYSIANGKLTINMSAAGYMSATGTYQCTASNTVGTAFGNKVNLLLGYVEQIDKTPKSTMYVNAYSWTVLNCKPPKYFPRVYFSWYFGDTAQFVRPEYKPYLFVSQNGNLYFSYVTQVDQGSYTCVVTTPDNSVGQKASPQPLVVNNAMDTINEPNIPNEFPAVNPSSPLRGDNVSLECFAYGKSTPDFPLIYTWTRLGGLQIPAKAVYSDLPWKRVLQIPNVELDDAGDYNCLVQRTNGQSASKSVTLMVDSLPYMTMSLADLYLDISSNVNLRCEAIGRPTPTYRWFKNGVQLVAGSSVGGADPARYTITANKLTINTVTVDDQGTFQCSADNTYGTAYSTANLRVLSVVPSFYKRPVMNALGSVGGSVTIRCSPEAAPTPAITWSHNGTDLGSLPDAVLGSSGNYACQSGNKCSIPITKGLFIQQLTASDAGFYKCTAKNNFGEASSTGYLQVVSAPTFIISPNGQTIWTNQQNLPNSDPNAILQSTTQWFLIGSSFFLRCGVNAPYGVDVTYVWQINGIEFPFDRLSVDNRRIYPTTFKQGTGQEWGNLYVYNVTFDYSWWYVCQVKTSYGSWNSSVMVSVYGPPGPCAGLYADPAGIQAYQVSLQWMKGAEHNSGNAGRILSYVIEARDNYTTVFYTLATNITEQVPPGGQTDYGIRYYTVTDLNPRSGYYFRVRALNVFGLGEPSSVLGSINTLPAAPRAYPANLTGGDGKVGTLNISWATFPRVAWGDDSGYFNVHWVYAEPGYSGQATIKEVPSLAAVRTSVRVGSDYTRKLYNVSIQACNSMGCGPRSPWVAIYSAENMPTVTVTNVRANSWNGTSIQVYWNKVDPNDAGLRGTVRGYRILYYIDRNNDRLNLVERQYSRRQTVIGNVDSAMLLALWPDTYYRIYVQVFNGAGNGPPSTEFKQTTWRLWPQTFPLLVQVTKVAADTVLVNFVGITITVLEETLDGYMLRYWVQGADVRTAIDIDCDRNTYGYITGLHTDTYYNVRVFAYSRGGDGLMSYLTRFILRSDCISGIYDNLDVRYVYICAGCALSPARILLALTALLALAFGRMIHA